MAEFGFQFRPFPVPVVVDVGCERFDVSDLSVQTDPGHITADRRRVQLVGHVQALRHRPLGVLHVSTQRLVATIDIYCRTAVFTVLFLHGTTVLDEFLGVVGERASDLYNTFCNTLPVLYMIDLQKLVFWRSLRRFENPVLRTLGYLNHNNFVATASKYGFDHYMVNVKYAICSLAKL